MKCSVSVLTIFVALKSVYSTITSNLSVDDTPEPNSGECLERSVDAALENLENCETNLELNLFESSIKDSLKVKPSSPGPLNIDQIITLKLQEHSCARASEYINEHNCKVFTETLKDDSGIKNQKNKTRQGNLENHNSISTTAIYLYGWLAYRLVFVFLKQI